MANDFFNVSGAPAARSAGSSSAIRAEFAAIAAAFDKMPSLGGNPNKLLVINPAANGLSSTSEPTLTKLTIVEGGVTGATANGNVDSLVIDGTGNTGISFLGAIDSLQQIRFGDTANNAIGGFSYNHGVDQLFCFAGGANVLTLDAAGISVAGVYRVGATQILTSRRTGWGAPTGTATRGVFATTTVTLQQLAERVKALIDDLTTHGLIGA